MRAEAQVEPGLGVPSLGPGTSECRRRLVPTSGLSGRAEGERNWGNYWNFRERSGEYVTTDTAGRPTN